MGTSDLKALFKHDRSATFKTSVIISYIAFIVIVLFYSHAVMNIRNNNVIDLSLHINTIYVMFFVGIISFMIRNFSKHKFLKGLFYIILKLFVLLIVAFLLYGMQLQVILIQFIVPSITRSDGLLVMGTLATTSLVKLILG
jgi:hypothetical protein